MSLPAHPHRSHEAHTCPGCDAPHTCACGPSPIDRAALGMRPRPPAVPCDWCGARAGEACRAADRRTRLATGSHPSRLEAQKALLEAQKGTLEATA